MLLGERVIEGGTLTPQAEHAKLHQAEICTFLSFLAVPGTCLAVVWGHEARESGEVSVELWRFLRRVRRLSKVPCRWAATLHHQPYTTIEIRFSHLVTKYAIKLCPWTDRAGLGIEERNRKSRDIYGKTEEVSF